MAANLDEPDVGRLIRARRLAAAWDQESLARLAGVSVRTVRNIELGRHSPRRATVQLLLEALPDISTDPVPRSNGTGPEGPAGLRIAVLGPLLVRRGPHVVDMRSR